MPAPPGPTLEAQLVAWASKMFVDERGKITPRLGIARERGFDVYYARELVDRMGPEGMMQALAVLNRTAHSGELVFALTRSVLSGAGVRASLGGSKGAVLYARSPDGRRVTMAFGSEQVDRNTRRALAKQIDQSSIDEYGDFTDPDYFVDPLVEDHLAKRGFPGAIAQLHAPSLVKPAPLLLTAAPRAKVTVLPMPTTGMRLPVIAWEAGRTHQTNTEHICLRRLMRGPLSTMPAAAPAHLMDRSLGELLSRQWASEAQAALIVHVLIRQPDFGQALEAMLASRFKESTKAFWCACAAALAYLKGDLPVLERAFGEALSRMSSAIAAAGGLEAFLEACWRTDEQHDPLGNSLIGSLVALDSLRVDLWVITATERPESKVELDAALARCRRVRDWLLDRCGVAIGEPGARVAALYDRVVSSGPEAIGDSREERLLCVARARVQKVPLEDTFRDYAAWHVGQLHSVTVCGELLNQFDRCGMAELGMGDTSCRDYQPELVSAVGLFTGALDMLCHHLRLRASVLCHAKDARHLAVLARAREIDPRDALTLGCFNEARFRNGERSDDLLKDLHEELRVMATLGTAAELLVVAGELGNGKSARKAREKVGMLSARGPHAWIAEMRLARARPGALASLDAVERLIAMAPKTTPDPGERAVFALYGPAPDAAIAEALRDLRVRREALEWDALVAEVASEDAERERESRPAAEPKPKRPPPPTEPGRGAVALALEALRARLDTRAVSRSGPKAALEAHARRAAELATIEDVALSAGWLGSLAGADGLVAALEQLIEAPSAAPQVADALVRADAALDAALTAAWQHDRLRTLASVWPTLVERGRSAGELRERYDAIATAIGDAAGPEARARIERDLTELMTAALAPTVTPAAPTVIDDDAEESADADVFVEMRLAPDALSRSREQLSTPEWALHEGLRQVSYYNLARGKRDVKMLHGTRDAAGAIWELRHRDGRHPVRVLYRLGTDGPLVIAVLAKEDDAHQRRMLVRIAAWAAPAS